jgi:hypothetical protein
MKILLIFFFSLFFSLCAATWPALAASLSSDDGHGAGSCAGEKVLHRAEQAKLLLRGQHSRCRLVPGDTGRGGKRKKKKSGDHHPHHHHFHFFHFSFSFSFSNNFGPLIFFFSFLFYRLALHIGVLPLRAGRASADL